MNKKQLILGSVISLFLFSSAFAQDAVTKATPTYNYGNIKVTRVIDGGTLELENGERVRLIGIDCPESKPNKKAMKDSQRTQQDLEAITKMGEEATEFVERLIKPGQKVRLEFDVQKTDKYGRLLAYVYILVCKNCDVLRNPAYEYSDFDEHPNKEDNDLGGIGIYIFLNATIIKSGYASPMTVPPNVKYAELFEKLYKQAREQKRGLWR